jgi:hypothetical protein
VGQQNSGFGFRDSTRRVEKGLKGREVGGLNSQLGWDAEKTVGRCPMAAFCEILWVKGSELFSFVGVYCIFLVFFLP